MPQLLSESNARNTSSVYKTIAVEWEHVEEGPKAIEQFMEDNGFVTFGRIATRYARDIIFVKDYLRFEKVPL